MSSRGQAGWYSHISSAAAGHGFEWILQGERSCGIYRSGGPEMEQRTPHSSVYSKGGWEPATKESSERETWLFKSLLADCWSAQLLSSYKPMRSYHFSLQYCKKKKCHFRHELMNSGTNSFYGNCQYTLKGSVLILISHHHHHTTSPYMLSFLFSYVTVWHYSWVRVAHSLENEGFWFL